MKLKGRSYRHKRFTKKIKGTVERPRLVIFRSKKHIYAQIINDQQHKVLAGYSTLTKEFKEKNPKGSDRESAKKLGLMIAEKAKKLGVEKVSFDRAGYIYHGRVKALADGAREGGLKF